MPVFYLHFVRALYSLACSPVPSLKQGEPPPPGTPFAADSSGGSTRSYRSRQRLTFDATSFSSCTFTLSSLIFLARRPRVRTLISSLYFDKSHDNPVLLQADGELTAHFFFGPEPTSSGFRERLFIICDCLKLFAGKCHARRITCVLEKLNT